MYCGEQSSSVKDVLAVPGSIRSSRGMSSLVSFTTCSRSCAWMTADSSAITVGQFEDLLSLVGPSIARLNTNYRRSIPPAERLSVCLRFLVTGDSFRTIAFSFRVGVVHGEPDHPPGSDVHLGLSSGRLHGCAFTWRLAVHHRGIPGALELSSVLCSSGWEAHPDKGTPYII
ncbi:uncharacterized protein LOC143413640 [Maylandia zebra]|uniref:uncharacterized protein LOC143413640 n=1 Tax=Maylandia zebra TaxID=106582 RepID=UPI00403C34F6